jgi:glucose/arabinose dehydrogenase/PKD repeat protein
MLARPPTRQALLVALVTLMTIGSFVLPGAAPAPVQAAQPVGAQCQQGFLQASPPTSVDQCADANGATPVAPAVPAGFQESVVWSGLTNPTAIRFAADGRVFVAEKRGDIKVFDNLSDTTPTVFSDLEPRVHNFWDRGLLGLALDPSLTGGTGTGSYVYVLYAYDHILGSSTPAPQWGDTCPSNPGATTDGCVISGRLSRFAVSGSTISGPEQVLIEDWCQQFPSHSIGSLVFGPDGALYVSGGDGANFNSVDYGQWGGSLSPVMTPRNPCGDPPGGTMSPPTAEGGALRSQDVRTSGASSSYSSTIMANAPLSYWRLGETSGTTAVDQTGAHSGTYFGGPTLGVAGAIVGDANTAVTLNGTSQYVTVPDSTPFRFAGTAPFSVEVWFKHTADSTYRRVISAENSSGLGWQIYSQSASWGFVRSGAGGSAEVSDGTPAGSGWIHTVATYDGTTMRLYKNGVEMPASLTSTQSLPSDTTFVIGRYGGANVSQFNGSIDEPAVYNYALTAAQVAAHYAAGISGGANGDPTGLDGAILRLNAATGAGMPGNPFAGSSDANARRIIAYGLRNPFRITTRPGTNELWVGDVGWDTWEEIDRIPDATDAVAENFGWPCYEGNPPPQSAYDGTNLTLCESLYSQGPGAVAAPYYTYDHAHTVVAGETCPTANGSSITGMAFYPEASGSYPVAYRGGLFFADHSRNCIWFIPKGANGQPNIAAIQTFIAGAANPVDLVIGPNNDLFYVDFDGGTIRRITATGSNQPPTAVIQATPTSGAPPLTVQFNGGGSSDPEGTPLTYAWDLNGDGLYDDATGVTTSWTYQTAGNVTTGLRVTDGGGASNTASQVISVGNTPPVPVISNPTSSVTWKVGDVIPFSGSATDAEDGNLPASALSWSFIVHHCPSGCHTHLIETLSGVASGTFTAPDHEYPSYLEVTLTATDSFGASATTSVLLYPQTVVLSFQTSPTGLSLAVNQTSSSAPFTRTVIIGSSNAVTATSPQALNGLSYVFSSWSDGLAQSHTIVGPSTNTTYTATYTSNSIAIGASADSLIRWNKASSNFGTLTYLRTRSGQYRSYLKFTVTGLAGPASSAKLRLWVTDASSTAGSAYLVASTWTETGITWNNAPVITGSPLSTVGAAPAGSWVEFNVAAAITGNGTYSFAISGGSTDAVDYASRETANGPILVLTP